MECKDTEDLRDEGKIKETAGKHEEEDGAQKRNETRMARAAMLTKEDEERRRSKIRTRMRKRQRKEGD